MNETQRRIKAYKAALPGLRERVIAVALLLAMSVAMMTSATFAWLTISKAPEVSGVNTTVAANGNLEIALATGDGKDAPGVSKVGDSASAEDQTMVDANVTWGNLVNLSDPSYGLNRMSLRPALLSTSNLSRYPLYGASYGEDGRVEMVASRYEYTSLIIPDDGSEPYFAGGSKANYGVRAIASVTYENITGNTVFTELFEKATAQYSLSRTAYINLVTDKTAIQNHGGVDTTTTKALGGLLSIYTQDMADTYLNGKSADSDCGDYIVILRNLMVELQKIIRYEGEALTYLANLQAYMHAMNVGLDPKTNTYENWDALLAIADFSAADQVTDATQKNNKIVAAVEKAAEDLKAQGIELISLTDTTRGLLRDWKILEDQIAAIENLMVNKGFYNDDGSFKTDPPVVKWSEFESILNNIVHIDSTEMDGTAIGDLNSSNLDSFVSSVFSGSPVVTMRKGVIPNIEQRTGVRMKDRNTMGKAVTVTVKVKVYGFSKSVSAVATTGAAPAYLADTDKTNTEKLNDNVQGGDAVSKDIYGLAIDLWVRTNTNDVVLTLEGTTIFTTEQAVGTDMNGNPTELFILSTEDGEVEIYKLPDTEGTVFWYSYATHQVIDSELLEGFDETDPKNFKTIQVVTGYEGENRVWEDWKTMLELNLIEQDNTTQGAGSCFVFYASPSEQDRILDLLRSFSVAFIDEAGNTLANAALNVDMAYAINGKVTVPLEMVDGTEYEDENGDDQFGITALERNTPTRITAVVYLNGKDLKNENVLADGSIEGNLNLQFGSSVSLTNPDNEALQAEYRTITAVASTNEEVDGDSPTTSDNQNSPIRFTYDGTPKSVTVDLTVNGTQPKGIQGFFIRTISSTQGSRGEVVTFDENEDGTWTGNFELTTPGTYVLRSLLVDGVEYTLSTIPSVSIAGLEYEIDCDFAPGLHMTADKSVDIPVTLRIHADQNLMPKQVRVAFRSDTGSRYEALMRYDSISGLWQGAATINSSGTYTMEYIVMDGEEFELNEQDKLALVFSLGMTTRIYTDSGTDFTFEGDDIPIVIKAKIWNDAPTEIKKLTGVKLYYHVEGSNLDQYGLFAELTWNEDTGYYVGNFNICSPGTYRFDRLQVDNVNGGSSTIRTAAAAPVFSVTSKEPPAYRDYVANEYQYAPITIVNGVETIADKDAAKLTITMDNVRGAAIWGVVKKGGTSYVVRGTLSNAREETVGEKTVLINDVDFKLPGTETVNGLVTGQDGEWTLTDIYLQNVYIPAEQRMYSNTVADGTVPTVNELMNGVVEDGDGNPVVDETTGQTQKAFYRITMSDKGGDKGVYAYVVTHINVELTKDGKAYTGQAFGGTKNNPTGSFMQSHTVSGFTVTVRDWNNQPIPGVESVTWSIIYNSATDVAYGGYDKAEQGQLDRPLAQDASDATRYVAADEVFRLAGEYTSTVTVMAKGAVLKSLTGPAFTVASKKPTVNITAISPANTFTAADVVTEGSGCNQTTTYYEETVTAGYSTDEKTGVQTATVYFSYNVGDYYITQTHNFTPPTVELQLTGIGSASSAYLTFSRQGGGTDNMLYTDKGGKTSINTYTWTADNKVTRYVGYFSGGTGDDTKVAAGTITATVLTLEYKNGNATETYTVTIPGIVINNPL